MLKIMELQGEIDCLLRDVESSPFSSQKWQNASLEAKQRVTAMAGIQFLIFEPVDRVDGNDKLKIAADNLLEVLAHGRDVARHVGIQRTREISCPRFY